MPDYFVFLNGIVIIVRDGACLKWTELECSECVMELCRKESRENSERTVR